MPSLPGLSEAGSYVSSLGTGLALPLREARASYLRHADPGRLRGQQAGTCADRHAWVFMDMGLLLRWARYLIRRMQAPAP